MSMITHWVSRSGTHSVCLGAMDAGRVTHATRSSGFVIRFVWTVSLNHFLNSSFWFNFFFQVCTKIASYLEQVQRLENLSWRLWHLQNLMVDQPTPGESMPVSEGNLYTRQTCSSWFHFHSEPLMPTIKTKGWPSMRSSDPGVTAPSVNSAVLLHVVIITNHHSRQRCSLTPCLLPLPPSPTTTTPMAATMPAMYTNRWCQMQNGAVSFNFC